jgi:diguanylate cyclase (GGDEF)-like protein
MIGMITGFLNRLTRGGLAFLIVGLVGIVGVIDYLTGFDVSVSFFYLIPISIAAWYMRRSRGVYVSLACALIWLGTNSLTSPGQGPSFYAQLWNAIVRLGFFLVVSNLLSSLHRSIEHEKILARTDFLTGVQNSRAFYERAGIELARARRYHRPVSIAYLDLDNFKELNDRLGHTVGDDALRVIGATMMQQIRVSDLIGRLGGDEFVLLLPESGQEDACKAGARLHEQLTAEIARHGWSISVSMGVITCADAPSDINELITEADRLMYSVKRSGKNAVRYKSI